jgi:hypothetical protein
MIVEYKLDAGPRGMVVPAWVKDGGYFQDPDSFTMVGWTPDAPREFKVPDTVLVLSKETLTTRVLSIHSRYPMLDPEDTALTTEQVTSLVSDWYDSK